MGIEDKEGFITRLYLPGRSDAVSEGPETALLGEAFAQLEAYFAGRRKTFDLPLRFDEGTPFMKQVWQALCMVCLLYTSSSPCCDRKETTVETGVPLLFVFRQSAFSADGAIVFCRMPTDRGKAGDECANG